MEKSEMQNLYCCICSVSLLKDEAISVFHENDGSLFEKIKKCLPFIICRTTKLDMYVCKTCLTELDISYRLIEKALKPSNIRSLQITTADNINSLNDEKYEQRRNNITTINRTEKSNELDSFEYCEVEIVSQEDVNGSDVENILEENENTDDELNEVEEVIDIDLENMDKEEQRTGNIRSQKNDISPPTKDCVMLENSELRKLSVNGNKNRYSERVEFTNPSSEQNVEDERSFESEGSTLPVILKDRKIISNSSSHDTSKKKPRSGSFMIECSVCKLIFRDKDEFLHHGCVESDSEHSVNAYVCHYCDFVFSCMEALKFHLQFNHTTKEASKDESSGQLFDHGADVEKLHTENFIEALATSDEEQYACTYCHGTFKSFEYLRRHINRRHKDFQICNSCRMIIKGGYKNLVDHQLQHCECGTGYKYKCGQCDEKFSNYLVLKKHLKVKHNLRHRCWTCTFCGKETCSKSSLMAHERTHTGLKPFQCKLCSKQFRSKPNLVQHSFTHTLVKRFLCDICQRSFSRKSYLVIHMRKHTGERPYACDICGHLYTQIGVMRRHRTKHFCETVRE